MILIVSMQSFSQQISTTTPSLTKADYLQKSKRQKTAAWILLGGGTSLVITGVIVRANKINNDGAGGIVTAYTSTSGVWLFGTGLVSMASSIPFFIASSKNKKKAMTMAASFKMETAPIIQRSSFVQTSFPVVSIKIDLK